MSDGAEVIPLALTPIAALKMIREIAKSSENIVVVKHAKKRQRQRSVMRVQIEACLCKGTIQEGPFMNDKGNWQVTMYRHAAGEEVNCVVAIDWPSKLIVVTVY